MTKYLVLALALFHKFSTQGKILMENDHYFSQTMTYIPDETAELNVWWYTELLKLSKRKAIDIIVFPEDTLTLDKESASFIPNPNDRIIPYKHELYKNYVIGRISEAAAQGEVYAVVNLYERVNCTKVGRACPRRGHLLYKTNVAIDRNGTVIARYRKYNPAEWEQVDTPQQLELCTFDTDFGVTFGMFSSSDILFRSPAMDLVQKKNVMHLAYPVYWKGEFPFLTDIQIQSGWSYALNVVLLASGAQIKGQRYSGGGPSVARKYSLVTMGKYSSHWTVELPKSNLNKVRRNRQKDIEQKLSEVALLGLEEDPTISSATSEELNVLAGKYLRKICHRDFCCNFSIEYLKTNVTGHRNYSYKVVVFRGERLLWNKLGREVAYCALVLCTDGNCAKEPACGNYPLIFDQVKIDTIFDSESFLPMPSHLLWKGNTDEPYEIMDYAIFSYKTAEDEEGKLKASIKYDNATIKNNFITFGIFGVNLK